MPMVAAGLIPDDPTLQPIRRLVSLVGIFLNVWYCAFLLHDPVLTSTAGCILLAASGIPEDQSANQNDQSVANSSQSSMLILKLTPYHLLR